MRSIFPLYRLIVLVLLAAGTARADLDLDFAKAIHAAKLGKTQYGLCVADAETGKVLVALNADEPMAPASNLKLVTTAAALVGLGPDFTFRTELRLLDAQPDAAVLLVKGDGDPGLGDFKLLAANKLDVEQVLAAWVQAVQKAGVKKIARLVLDDRVFDRQLLHPEWPKNQLDRWFCAPVSGLNFCDNCLDVYAAPTTAGKAPTIQIVPDSPFLTLANHAVSGGADSFTVALKGENELVCSGNVRGRSIDPLSVPVRNPAVFFGQVFASRLHRAGIEMAALVQPGEEDRLPEGKPLHYLQTSLPVVFNRCNMDSQNLFAECLAKRLGRAVTGNPGSWENGAAAVRTILAQRLGPKASALVLSDGSGLSRDNRVTASLLVELLISMDRDPRLRDIYRSSLSVDHFDGKPKERLHDLAGVLTCRLYPKTGYIAQVNTLSGYLVLPPGKSGKTLGRTIAFSFLFNNVEGQMQVREAQEQLLRLIDRQVARP